MSRNLPSWIDYEDLVQEGTIGLLSAASRYDSEKGIKFNTFIYQRVQGAIVDALRTQSWSRGIRKLHREIDIANEKLTLILGTSPTIEQLAVELDITVLKLFQFLNKLNALDDFARNGISFSILPLSSLELIEQKEVQSQLEAGINQLVPLEKFILMSYYYQSHTLRDIGDALDMSESRVSQLHAKAIKHLRVILAVDAS